VPTGEGDYLELIETPGHSTDHHVVRAPGRGWLFSSDLYITKR
jgi:glyoxylase-like metal-dependent hydrolase (beta-lactamase superfamily II)